VLLLALPDLTTGSTFSRRGVDGHTGPCFCNVTRGSTTAMPSLLGHPSPLQTSSIAVSYECRRSRRQRHSEVRPWTHQSTARQAALAPGHSSVGAVQAVFHGPPMSAAQGSTVHDGLLHPHLRHCSSPAPADGPPAVSQSPAVHDTATPASFNVRSSGLFYGRPGPAAWNSLPDYLREPTSSFDSFRSDLKTFLFSLY